MLSYEICAYDGYDESYKNFEHAPDADPVADPNSVNRAIHSHADDDPKRKSVEQSDHILVDHRTFTPPGGGAPEPTPSGGS